MRRALSFVGRARTFVVLGVVALALAVPALAGATTPTVPDMSGPISSYGDTLSSQILSVATTVLPYAAVFTALGIGFAFLKGWVGRRKATSIAH